MVHETPKTQFDFWRSLFENHVFTEIPNWTLPNFVWIIDQFDTKFVFLFFPCWKDTWKQVRKKEQILLILTQICSFSLEVSPLENRPRTGQKKEQILLILTQICSFSLEVSLLENTPKQVRKKNRYCWFWYKFVVFLSRFLSLKTDREQVRKKEQILLILTQICSFSLGVSPLENRPRTGQKKRTNIVFWHTFLVFLWRFLSLKTDREQIRNSRLRARDVRDVTIWKK